MMKDGLVYWGLTPQQQPGSYQGGENDDEVSFLVEETMMKESNQFMKILPNVYHSEYFSDSISGTCF